MIISVNREAREFPRLVPAQPHAAARGRAQLQRLRGVPAPRAPRLRPRARARSPAPPLALLPRVRDQILRRHRQVLHRVRRQTAPHIDRPSACDISSLFRELARRKIVAVDRG